MSLETLERDFQALVVDGTPGIEQAVVGTRSVPVSTRLAIYSNAYRARLAEALESNYPKLAKLLGEAQFGKLALLYIDRYPSTHYSIRWFGERLPELLAGTHPYSEQPILAELARWEWAMTLAFDAADVPLATAADLAEHPPEAWGELRFRFHPSLQLLRVHTNAPLVWRALSRDEKPPQAVRADAGHDWLVWRRGLDTFYRSVDAAEARALHEARGGANFSTVCEVVAAAGGEEAAPVEAAKLLSRWLADELISGLGAA